MTMSPPPDRRAPRRKRPKKQAKLKSKKQQQREKYIVIGVAVAGAVTTVLHLFIQLNTSSSLSKDLELKEHLFKADRVLIVSEDEEKFMRELDIAKIAAEEDIAKKNRREEMEKRKSYDPSFALSATEKNMLEMEKLGRDEGLDNKELLTKMAKMASLPGSGVGVFKKKRGGYKVEIAFPYPAVVEHNPRYENYSKGIYREVRKEAAGIVHDIYKFGGHRGVTEIVVRCQKVITIRGRQGSKHEKRDLYIVSATKGKRDWGSMDREEVEKACKLKKDVFPQLLQGQ
jgi:hypothetical protein